MTLDSSAVAQTVVTQASSSVLHTTSNAGIPVSSGTVTAGTVCPKCGKIHAPAAGSGPSITSPVAPVSYSTPVQGSPQQYSTASHAAPQPVSGGSQNVLGMLNGQRSRQGLRSLRYDGALQAVAARRAQQMASMGIKSHPPGSFAPGRYEGVGWSSSFSPSGVYACYTSDPNMTAAGAAMVRGRDGVYFAVVYR